MQNRLSLPANFSASAAFLASALAFFASIFAINSSGVNLASLINELTLSLTCAPLETQDSSLSRSIRSLSSFPLALGLKKNDIILEIANNKVNSILDVSTYINASVSDKILFKVQRNLQEISLSIKLV